MDDFKEPGDAPHRSDISPEHSPSSKRDNDIARVYELLQSRQPWGAVLDAAMASIDKNEERPEQPSDMPSLSTLVQSPAPHAIELSIVGSVDEEVTNFSTESNSLREASELPHAGQTIRGRFHHPKSLLLVSAVIAATIGFGFLARVGPPHENHVNDGSVRPLPPIASETGQVPPTNPAPAVSNVSASLVATRSMELKRTLGKPHMPLNSFILKPTRSPPTSRGY